MNFLNDISSKTTISSGANLLLLIKSLNKTETPIFLILSECFISKGNLFDVNYISLPLYCLHV